ncbi:MAG: hypothetical protein JNM14_04320 [Ferruginibacter sp.]|nr:hypothetical protein [Ferruginibacter sp.]
MLVATASAQDIAYKTVIDLNSYKIYETNIRKITEDKYGYKWIASQESALRYDGRLIHRLSHADNFDKYRLAGVDVWDIEEDQQSGEMYILTSFGDIDVLNTASASLKYRIKRPAGPDDNWFMDIILTPNSIWVNSFNGLYRYQKNTGKYLPVSNYLKHGPGDAVSKRIFLDDQNNIWAFDKNAGIEIFNAVTGKVINTGIRKGRLPQGIIINDIIQLSGSKLMIASSFGLYTIEYTDLYNISIVPFLKVNTMLPQESVESLTLAGDYLYFSAKTIYKYDLRSGFLNAFNDRNAFSSKNMFQSVQALFHDSKEMLWVGGRDGLGYFDAGVSGISGFYKDPENKNALEHVFYVVPENGAFYASTMNGLYKVFPDGSINAVKKEGWFNYQFKIDKSRSIVSERNRLYVLQNERLENIENVYPEFKPYCNYSLNSHVLFGDSIIVLGTENFMGVLIWSLKQKKIRNILSQPQETQPASLVTNIVNTVFSDSKNEVVILNDKSISRLNISTLKTENYQLTDAVSKMALGTLFDIISLNDDYWIAVYGTGIVRTDKNFKIKKIYSTSNGLSNNGVYKLLKTNDTTIYITTNNGLNVFNTKKETFFHRSVLNGLHSNTFEEACGFIDESGKITAGGVKGFSVINPALIQTNHIPPVLFFSKVDFEYPEKVIDSINLNIQQLNVRHDILQLTVFISGINWGNPAGTSFLYRILEKGKDWISLNGQNFITLINMSPGTYHLQVKAANEDGVWSEPKELILVFEPKWYQTWWFYLLIGLAVAAILYALYRYRISQIKKQHEIRKNIATDLHDDLGSTLNSVKVFTNLAISGVKQEESLQQVKDNLTEATMSLRDMIWVLDDSLDTVDELVTRLKQFAIPVTGASNMEFVINADSEVNNRQLTKEEKRNLFLICKEVINNSIKYSGGNQIEVDIKPSGKKIQIAIADNGKGFDEATVKKGYGLKNMQYRAGQIKYKVRLTADLNKGTQVFLLPV